MERLPPMWLLLVLLLLARPGSAWKYTSQFKHWYPQYQYIWRDILETNCSKEYDVYLTGRIDYSKIDWLGGGGTFSGITQPVMQCILSHASEYVKSVMTCSQVLLGITPTILAVLGAGSEELALLPAVAHRPLLAVLLALGSPSVFLPRAFKYYDPEKILVGKGYRYRQRRLGKTAARACALFEYALAALSVANVGLTCYELGVQSISNVMSDVAPAPLVWAILVVPIHLVGYLGMRRRVRRAGVYQTRRRAGDADVTEGARADRPPKSKNTVGVSESEEAGLRGSARRLLWRLGQQETMPSVAQERMVLEFRHEDKLFILLHWFLSTGIICHIIFGTFLLSSYLFMGPKDGLSVVGRLMASVLVCRIILMYEIAGMRETYHRSKHGDSCECSKVAGWVEAASVPQAPRPGREEGVQRQHRTI